MNPILFENILDDVLLGGAAAAEIFVKNPNHQTEAAHLITAFSNLLQVIHAQINGNQSAAAPTQAPAA